MRYFIFILLLIGLSLPAEAGNGIPVNWKEYIKRLFGSRNISEVPSSTLDRMIGEQVTAKHIGGAAAFSLEQSGGTMDIPLPHQNIEFYNPYKHLLLKNQEQYFNQMNDHLVRLWRNVAEQDLLFMRQHKKDLLRSLRVSYEQKEVDYVSLIPSEAKYIQVGEEHGFLPLRKAFESMVLQYKEKYPDRKIIVLTEFVFDRTLPLSEKTGEPVSLLALKYRRVSPDFRFLEKFVKRGIDVIGLEDERYFRSHQQWVTPSFRQVETVFGMKQRNDHWRTIIEDVRQREPDAVFFIYTGNMHVHYRAPFSLAKASNKNFVIQLFAGDLGKDLPIGYLLQKEPFSQVAPATKYPTVLSWQPKSPYHIYSGFDACLIFPVE